jgi:Rrf2 family protein
MLGKTSIYAIRSLLLLAQQDPGACWSPRRLAEALGESPTYLAKVMRHLVRGGILDAEKGVKGGVRMRQAPAEITLLAIVEACQGAIAADYCRPGRPVSNHCAFHAAALELHEAITNVLGRWTLADLLAKPGPGGETAGGTNCLIDIAGLTQLGER